MWSGCECYGLMPTFFDHLCTYMYMYVYIYEYSDISTACVYVCMLGGTSPALHGSSSSTSLASQDMSNSPIISGSPKVIYHIIYIHIPCHGICHISYLIIYHLDALSYVMLCHMYIHVCIC